MFSSFKKTVHFVGGVIIISLFFLGCGLISSVNDSNTSVRDDSSSSENMPNVEVVVESNEFQEATPTETQVTPAPTSDPHPALPLPFEDRFDGGISSAWRVISGNPVISSGRLGAARNNEINLEIGNGQLKNYTITTQIYGRDDSPWGGYFSEIDFSFSPAFKLRITTADFSGRLTWYAYENNQWSQILRTETDRGKNGDSLKITVNENAYSVFINGVIVGELVYGPVRDAGSPLILRIKGDNIWLDFLSIQ